MNQPKTTPMRKRFPVRETRELFAEQAGVMLTVANSLRRGETSKKDLEWLANRLEHAGRKAFRQTHEKVTQ